MATNLFISRSKVPPTRWRVAFPAAVIASTLPAKVPANALVWLHNLAPAEFVSALPKGVRIIALHDEPNDENGLAALSSGAAGYANAHAAPQVLQTIESVVRSDGLWVGESLLSRLLRSFAAAPASPSAAATESNANIAKLTEREREVALKVARGESNKEIARELAVSERTVKAHLTAVFDKVGVRDRLQLAIQLKAAS